MREIRRSALVPYSALQMYELVADVERYPEFLPWCTAARMLERQDETVLASLSLAKGRASASFTTRNTVSSPGAARDAPRRGAFLEPGGTLGLFRTSASAGSRVELAMRFAAAATLTGILLGRPSRASATSSSMPSAAARGIYGAGKEAPPVTVVVAGEGRQTRRRLEVEPGTPRSEAVDAVRRAAEHPELGSARPGLCDLRPAVRPQQPVEAGDRIEVLRPLVHDPRRGAGRWRARAGRWGRSARGR
jgi:coenzyme Q-binding protein COQ10